MNQITQKKTKREEFLDAMEKIIPWSYRVDMIRPYYFKNKRGRKPIGIETMLRMYLMQIWFNLSDEGIEDSIYDSYAMRSFMHIDFNEQQVPDATTRGGTITGTSANVHDVSATSKLLRKDDHVVYGDSGYLGAPDRPEIKGDEVFAKMELRINKRPSSLKTADNFEGINKNINRFHVLFASANLLMCSRAFYMFWGWQAERGERLG